MSNRILFGGMVSSGKSTLVCSVYQLLLSWGEDVSLHEIDIWSDTHACILGHKAWDQRNNTRDNSSAIHQLFRENVERFAEDDATIVLGDMPGRECNDSFPLLPARFADAGVLITRSPLPKDTDPLLRSSAEGWRRLFRLWQIPILEEVRSLREGDQPPLEGFHVGALDRKPKPDDSDIERFATHLLTAVKDRTPIAA